MGPVDLDLLVSVSIFFSSQLLRKQYFALALATCHMLQRCFGSRVTSPGWLTAKGFPTNLWIDSAKKNGSEAQKLDRSKTPAQRQNHIMKWNPDSRCWVRVSEAVQFAMQFITIFPSRTLHWKLVNVNARRGRRRRSVGQPRMTCLWLPADSRLQTSIKF